MGGEYNSAVGGPELCNISALVAIACEAIRLRVLALFGLFVETGWRWRRPQSPVIVNTSLSICSSGIQEKRYKHIILSSGSESTLSVPVPQWFSPGETASSLFIYTPMSDLSSHRGPLYLE